MEEDDDDTSGSGSGYDDLNSFQVPGTLFHNAIYNPPFTDSTLILESLKDLRWLEWLY